MSANFLRSIWTVVKLKRFTIKSIYVTYLILRFKVIQWNSLLTFLHFKPHKGMPFALWADCCGLNPNSRQSAALCLHRTECNHFIWCTCSQTDQKLPGWSLLQQFTPVRRCKWIRWTRLLSIKLWAQPNREQLDACSPLCLSFHC